MARRSRVQNGRGWPGCGCLLLLLLIASPFAFGLWVIYENYAAEYGAPHTRDIIRAARAYTTNALESLGEVEATPAAAAPAPRATPTPIDPTERRAAAEAAIIERTNRERAKHGLRPLVHDPAIDAIARAHSRNMLARGKLTHVLDGLGANDRALRAGYDCKRWLSPTTYEYGLSENVWRVEFWGKDYSPDDVAFKAVLGWMYSDGHRANILDPDAVRIGVGVARGDNAWYATQNFSKCE